MSAGDERIILGEPVGGSGTLLRRYAVIGTGPRREVAPRFIPPRPLPAGTTAADLARREARRHGYDAVAVGALEVSTWPN
jgi:hypothetical protein